MQNLKRFVVIMYSKGCGLAMVNEARHRLFTSGKRTLENILPTQAALFEHINRALLQASFFWKQGTSVHQEIPVFSEWGWRWKTKVSGYHIGQHSMMPVRHVPYSSNATAESRVQGTVNAIRQVSAAPVCVTVKMDVLTTTKPAHRSDRLDSVTLVFMFINQTFMLQFSLNCDYYSKI